MFRKTTRNSPRNNSRINRPGLLAGLLATGLSVPALAQSVPFPTYTTGPQPDGSYVVSDGTIITPAGTQVYLGITTRAKAVALNPTGNHTAAVLQMGTSRPSGAVEIFNTQTGAVLQSYSTLANTDSSGSHSASPIRRMASTCCSARTAATLPSPASIRTGLLSDYAHVSVPLDGTPQHRRHELLRITLNTVTCFPNSPPGTDGSLRYPLRLDRLDVSTSTHFLSPRHRGLAGWQDRLRRAGQQRYADQDRPDRGNTEEGAEIRVGNVPHSVVISPRRQDRLRLQRGRPDCYRERLPGILQRHPGRRRISDRLHGHRHRFRGRPVHVYGHRQHQDRSAPDRHGVLGQVPAGRQYL